MPDAVRKADPAWSEEGRRVKITFRPLTWRELFRLDRSIVRDFHPHELRGYRYARREVLEGKALALAVEAGGAYAGYLIHQKPDSRGLLRVAYLAVEPGYRGLRIGEAALRLLRRRYPHAAIYFEVEDPDSAGTPEERALMERRISFYRRSGYHLLGFRLEAGPWRLDCMSSDPGREEEILRRYRNAWTGASITRRTA